MKVQMRRKMVPVADQEPVPSCQDTFEWSPKPDRWYTVHRRNIAFQNENGDGQERSRLIGDFFNALYGGLVVTARARYFKSQKTLEVGL